MKKEFPVLFHLNMLEHEIESCTITINGNQYEYEYIDRYQFRFGTSNEMVNNSIADDMLPYERAIVVINNDTGKTELTTIPALNDPDIFMRQKYGDFDITWHFIQ